MSRQFAFQLTNLINDKPICLVRVLDEKVISHAKLLHEIDIEDIGIAIIDLEKIPEIDA